MNIFKAMRKAERLAKIMAENSSTNIARPPGSCDGPKMYPGVTEFNPDGSVYHDTAAEDAEQEKQIDKILYHQ